MWQYPVEYYKKVIVRKRKVHKANFWESRKVAKAVPVHFKFQMQLQKSYKKRVIFQRAIKDKVNDNVVHILYEAFVVDKVIQHDKKFLGTFYVYKSNLGFVVMHTVIVEYVSDKRPKGSSLMDTDLYDRVIRMNQKYYQVKYLPFLGEK